LVLHQLKGDHHIIRPVGVLPNLPTLAGINGVAQKGTADGIPLNVSEGDGFDLRSGGSGHGGVVRLTPIDSLRFADSATPLGHLPNWHKAQLV